MRALNILLRPIRCSERTSLICGTVLLMMFVFSAVFISVCSEIMLPAMIAVLVLLSVMYYRMKLYRLMMKLPPIFMLISLLIAAYCGVLIYRDSDFSGLKRTVQSVSSGTAVFFFAGMGISLLLTKASDRPHPENLPKALAAAFPLLFTVFTYVPTESYFTNAKDFMFVYFDFAPYLFIKTAVLTLIAAAAACALNEKLFRVAAAAAAGLTLCVYCQYMFMNGDLPLDMGGKPDWDALHTRSVINALIWAALFLLPIVFTLLAGRIRFISGNAAARNAHLLLGCLICGMQLVSMVTMIFSSQQSLFRHERYVLDNSEQFVVSGKKNIITILLDASDRHYFDEAYEKDPEKFEFLHDFTYYTNCCMMYDSTYISIPQMLSGAAEPPREEVVDWEERVWHEEPCETFYSRLHEAGYKVNLFGDFSYNTAAYRDKADNCIYQAEDKITVNRQSLYDSLGRFSAYRYMPMLMKPSFDDAADDLGYAVTMENDCIIDNFKFLENLRLQQSDEDKNYFIFEHLIGTHLNAGATEPNVNACLEILRSYTDQLRELGLYDDAVIIVTGDHGVHFNKDNFPVCYVKRAGEHHDMMQYSDAPIHHQDYLATCLDAAGLKRDGDEELFGRPIFDIPEDEQRERLVFQRTAFEHEDEIEWQKHIGGNHFGALFGYRFIGDRDDLARREESGPPDLVLEFDSSF